MKPCLRLAVLGLLTCVPVVVVSDSHYELATYGGRRRSFYTDALPGCTWPPEYAYAFSSLGSFLQWTTQFIEATFYRANITTPMPYSALGIPLGLELPTQNFQMDLCERKDAADCLYYGMSRANRVNLSLTKLCSRLEQDLRNGLP